MKWSWMVGSRRLGPVAALPALALLAACERGTTEPDPDPHRDLDRVEIIDRGQTAQPVVAEWTADDGWEGELPVLDLGQQERLSLGVRIFDSDGAQLVQAGGEYMARYLVASEDPAGVVDMDHPDDVLFHGDHVHIYGGQEGTAEIQFVLWHVDHADGNTDPIQLTVVGPDEDTEDLATVEIIDRGQTGQPVVATWTSADGWEGELPALNLAEAERVSLGARMYDGDGEEYELEEGGEWSVRYWIEEGATEGVVNLDFEDDVLFHGDHVHVYGEGAGTTQIYFILWHVDHMEDRTDPIDFTVVDEAAALGQVDIRDRGQTDQPVVATWTPQDGWDGEIPALDLAERERLSLGVDIFDGAGNPYEVEEGGEWEARFRLADDAAEGVVDLNFEDDVLFHGDHVHVYGEDIGETELVFILWHDDHAEAETGPIAFTVVNSAAAVSRIDIRDRSQTAQPVVATWAPATGWEGELPVLDLSERERLSLGVDIYDGTGEQYTLEEDGEWEARFRLADDAEEGVVDLDRDDIFHGDHVHVYGLAAGETELVFILWHDDHAEAESGPIQQVVTE